MNNAMTVLYRGKHVDFVTRRKWEFVHRRTVTGIVVIAAVTPEKKILLVEQFRPPVNARVIELPAGLAGDVRGSEREDLAEAAKRELMEETGYAASGWRRLFFGPPSAGATSEVVTFFKATRLQKQGKGGGDAHEEITVHEVPVRTVDAWLKRKTARGMMIDPKVYAGLYFVR